MTIDMAGTTATSSLSAAANSEPQQMHAVTQDRYGDADVLSYELIDRPDVTGDQVLVEVQAAGIDRGTEHLMTGLPYLVRISGFGLTKPKNPVPGFDVSGRVVAVGPDVTRFSVGDEVFGIVSGGLAEYAVAVESTLVHKPAALSFEEAAVATVSGITALQALTDVGCMESGQRVLVIGASGGVGSFAVQLAVALGARVDGVAGTANLDMVRALGAADVIDHRTTDLATLGRTYDLVIDTGGRNRLRTLRHLLEPTGTLVIVGGENGNRITGGFGRQIRAALLSPFVGHRLAMFISKEDTGSIERLAAFLEAGSVRSSIGQSYPLERAADAMQAMAEGRNQGKTAIVVRPAS